MRRKQKEDRGGKKEREWKNGRKGSKALLNKIGK